MFLILLWEGMVVGKLLDNLVLWVNQWNWFLGGKLRKQR